MALVSGNIGTTCFISEQTDNSYNFNLNKESVSVRLNYTFQHVSSFEIGIKNLKSTSFRAGTAAELKEVATWDSRNLGVAYFKICFAVC